MTIPKSVQSLIEAFERLPGIGPKTAARLTYHLLRAPKEESEALAKAAGQLKEKTMLCSVCKNITESDPCAIDQDTSRDSAIVCVVEEPLDVLALEKSGAFRGKYHVLHGVISPLNNIGPEELFIKDLLYRMRKEEITELILALNPSMEGEATSLYLHRLLSPLGVKVTRIARGLPVGGDLEYADDITLKRAVDGRMEY